jgi:hypothetical protein
MWTSPKTFTSAVLSSTEMNTHLRDNLLHLGSTTGNLTAGPHGIGTVPTGNVQFVVGGAFNASGTAATSIGLLATSEVTVAANQSGAVLYVGGGFAEAASGTHLVFAGAYVTAPAISAGAAALTHAATVWIAGVPTGATNTAALVVDGHGDDGIHVALADTTDVAHGMTSQAPTGAYGVLRKVTALDGGLVIQGYSEAELGLMLSANATTAITTAATGSNGALCLVSALKTGTTVGAFGATGNTVVFFNHTSATHIFKGNGDSYEDGTGWTAYDDTDDAALIETLEYELTAAQGHPIRRQFSAWLAEHRALLERQQLATFNADGSIFVNRSGIQALLCGFARQATARIVALEQRLARLEMQHG